MQFTISSNSPKHFQTLCVAGSCKALVKGLRWQEFMWNVTALSGVKQQAQKKCPCLARQMCHHNPIWRDSLNRDPLPLWHSVQNRDITCVPQTFKWWCVFMHMKLAVKQETLKLYYCHAYLQKRKLKSISFLPLSFSHPRYVNSADNESKQCEQFYPRS